MISACKHCGGLTDHGRNFCDECAKTPEEAHDGPRIIVSTEPFPASELTAPIRTLADCEAIIALAAALKKCSAYFGLLARTRHPDGTHSANAIAAYYLKQVSEHAPNASLEVVRVWAWEDGWELADISDIMVDVAETVITREALGKRRTRRRGRGDKRGNAGAMIMRKHPTRK